MTTNTVTYPRMEFLETCHQCDACLVKDTSLLVTGENNKVLATVNKLMACGRCLITQYCSTECQKAHWAEHKKLCHLPPSTRTKEEYRSCINASIQKTERVDIPHCYGKAQAGFSFAAVAYVDFAGTRIVHTRTYVRAWVQPAQK